MLGIGNVENSRTITQTHLHGKPSIWGERTAKKHTIFLFAFPSPLPGTGVIRGGGGGGECHLPDLLHHSLLFLSQSSCHLCLPGHIILGIRRVSFVPSFFQAALIY